MKAKGVKTMKERRPLVAGINSTSSVDPAVEDEFVFAHKPKATESSAGKHSERRHGKEGAGGQRRQPPAADHQNPHGLRNRPQESIAGTATQRHGPQYPSGHP